MNTLKKLIPARLKPILKRILGRASISDTSETSNPVTVITFPYLVNFDVHGLNFQFYIANSTGREWYDISNEEINALAEPKALMSLLSAGDKVLEIGSHQGLYSTIIAKIIGSSGKLLALDAFPQNSFTVNANFGVNGFGHAKAMNIAGAQETGEVEFSLDENGSVLLEGETWHSGAVFKVPAMSVDDLDKKYGPFNAIKIDVEGLEQQVLQGAKEFLRRKPKIAIEIHRDSMLGKHNGSVEEILKLINIDKYQTQIFYKARMQELEVFEQDKLEPAGDFNLFLKPKN